MTDIDKILEAATRTDKVLQVSHVAHFVDCGDDDVTHCGVRLSRTVRWGYWGVYIEAHRKFDPKARRCRRCWPFKEER